MADRVALCRLCGKHYRGMGHNGEPLTHGRVCDECNREVIEARLAHLLRREA